MINGYEQVVLYAIELTMLAIAWAIIRHQPKIRDRFTVEKSEHVKELP